MNKPLLALLPLLSLGLTGCMGTLGVSYDRQTTLPLNAKEMGAQPPCALRVCVTEPRYSGFKGSVQNSHIANLQPYFSSVVVTEEAAPEICDLALRHDSPLIDFASVSSVYTGKFLARFTMPHWSLGGAVCKFFGEGSEGYAKIGIDPSAPRSARAPSGPTPRAVSFGFGKTAAAPAAAPARSVGMLGGSTTNRAPAPAPFAAPAPAPSQGLSSSDIERIAPAVRGADAPAPAPAAAAAAARYSPGFSSAERPDDLAVVIGIESYSEISTKAPYAERDADAFKAAVRALGVPERNIALLKGPKAGKAALEKNLEAWLGRLAKPGSRVYVYFSGHGAPDVKTGQAYLVPWDGDPNFLAETAYPVARLYKKLGALPAKQVLVAMDSCFSGAGGRSVLASGARPLVAKVETGAVPAKITVLSASAGTEISGSLDDRQHGAFTWFLLEGLNAGKTTPAALAEYLTPRVQDEAKRLNRDQTPQLQGDGAWSLR